jgi:hypothetical protein
MCEFWNDPQMNFLEGVERLCVSVCVCMFEDEVGLEYEHGVEFATQSA